MDSARSEAGPGNIVIEGLEHATTLMLRHVSHRGGYSMTTLSVMARLEREGPARLTALAAAEGVAQPSMSQLVQRLEREDLATRVGDPADGRASLIALTDEGRALLADGRRSRHARLADLLAALPPEDQAALALAMHVAVPVVRRLLDQAAQPQAPGAGRARTDAP
ncbi:MarR family winged helix-turn-helix transcriptional regulator [Streptomyces sp. NBC_01477]|uniref:MarR family winged helix-turn-helix transcriptional regulator n=1 Tax=Streptomyces sp. NBC_01477 TaxID=2976015 RepID=UPI002E36492F|nr:MarR family winged helix-turn-helix transcriptional regulator [Streptomyces sp. NBC_01477]